MKKLLVILSLICTSAYAEDSKTVSITYNQTLEMLNALANLDKGEDKIVGSGPTEKAINQLFDFDVPFFLVKVKNLAALKEDLQTFNATRQDIIKKFAGPSGRFDPPTCTSPTDQSTCRVSDAEFQANTAITKLAETKHNVPLIRMALHDFKLEKNHIKSLDLAALTPILDLDK